MYKKTMRIGEYSSGTMYYDSHIGGCPYGSCGIIYRTGKDIMETLYYSYKTVVATVDHLKGTVTVSGYRHWSRTTQKHLRAIYASVLSHEQEQIARAAESTEILEFPYN